MSKATGLPGGTARVLLDLPEHRMVTIEATAGEDGCWTVGCGPPGCTTSTQQRLTDVPVADWVEVVLVKRRFVGRQRLCGRCTFIEVNDEVPVQLGSPPGCTGKVDRVCIRPGPDEGVGGGQPGENHGCSCQE